MQAYALNFLNIWKNCCFSLRYIVTQKPLGDMLNKEVVDV
jgi:hypothetical protein